MLNKTERKVLTFIKNAVNKNKYKYIDYTNQQIADRLGISAVYINKIIAKLFRAKLLKVTGKTNSRIIHFLDIVDIQPSQDSDTTLIQHRYNSDTTLIQHRYNSDTTLIQPNPTSHGTQELAGSENPPINTNINSNTNINNICLNDIFLKDKVVNKKSQAEQDFEVLYKLYQTVPPPQGRTSRKKSFETYQKLHKSNKLPNFEILEAKIEQYNLSLDPSQGGKYKKGFQYWLSAEAWDDDYVPWRESQTSQRSSREPMNEAIEADGDFCIFF